MVNHRIMTTLLLGAAVAVAGCSKKKNQDQGTPNPAEGSGASADPGGGTKPAGGGGVVKVDGSSTVELISSAVAEEFGKAGKGQAAVGESGTGGGLQKFCRGEVDVANASRPIKSSEADACKAGGIEFIELPVAYDGLAVVVHKDNKFVDHLTVAELKTMWAPEAADKIKTWKQVRASFPDDKLALYGPGTDSGTFDYFTQAVVGKEKASRGDYTSSENDNVLVQGVSGDKGGLGYFGYAYYKENQDKLKIVPIDDGKDDNGKGPIAPDEATVANGTYQPLSRPLFIYVSVPSLAKPSVQAFIQFYLEQAKTLSAEVGYVPLPDKAYELATARFTARKTGSMFAGGSQVGVTIEQLLAAEAK
jgi:phosphate transport system substrate-binding protein